MNDMNHSTEMNHSGHGTGGAEQDLTGSGTTTRAEAVMMQQEALSGAHHSAHMDDSVKQGEHLNLMKLLPDASEWSTSVAINGGSWFDGSTWTGGKVPGAGADVYIPHGISVVYDGVSTAELGTVGVDGGLHFAVDTDTRMEVESLLTGASSTLTIGVEGNPVQPDVNAEIVITDSKINLSEDPSQLGHGVVTHGAVEIHGATKAPYLRLAEEPEAGDRTLKLEGDVDSWQVGDSLVVMGTEYVGNSNGILQTQDEEVTIVAIDAATGTVTINRPLTYDHTTPDYEGRDGIDNELSVYVGNSSRNVTISSENPEGVRGHVMFMHNPDVEVRYAEFDELGRTDKSKPINTNELWDEDDWSNRGPGIKNGPGEDVIGTARNPGTENVEGRYALHIHRTGAEEDAKLAILEGNSVTGSPGWGIVHHDSHAAVDYNFVYGVAGAGIVSEDANETGQWIGNFVTSTVGTGRDPNRDGDANVLTLEKSGDFGIEGVAYESQARQIIQQDNIAANSKTAWMFNTSETSTQGPSTDVVQFDPSGNPFEERDRYDEEETSIMGFSGNQIIAVEEGIFTGHRNIDNATDIQQTFSDLTIYGVQNEAVHIFNYTNEYVFKDTLIVDVGRGFKIGDKAEGINLSNVHVEDAFEVFNSRGYNADGTFVDVTWNDVDRGLTGRDMNGNLVSFDNRIIDGSKVAPVNQITFKADSGTKMTIRPDGGDIDIRGTLTDSVGTFKFHANTWYRQDVHTFDGLQTELRSRDVDYALDKYGAIQNSNGTWDLAFYWWVGDRMTGENQAVFIPLRLEGFKDSELQQYKVAGFTPPSNEIKHYYQGGIDSIDQDFGTGGTGHGGDD
ncbi:G8 domain-containing protein, partial [Ruegeria hyattellae]|uniref:G8 domain-containing protein n=1 Tax=Ruegeria hyattellae TaxID=3233337 RepID=UPI00355AF38C